jgi:uncharacterized membrane protein YgdD (TMEM256/DUF423 family)
MPLHAAAGALLAAAGVGLGAYAAHAATPDARLRLYMAAAFAFGHGASLAVLAMDCPRRLGRAASWALLVGTVLFAGSLAGAALAGLPTRLAPLGGLLLIGGWLLLAVDRLRR